MHTMTPRQISLYKPANKHDSDSYSEDHMGAFCISFDSAPEKERSFGLMKRRA